MIRENEVYEAKDGKVFKTKQDAVNHDKKIAVDSVLSELNMTEDEVAERLKLISGKYISIKTLIEVEPDWTKWATHHISYIDAELLEKPQSITIYVMKYKSWGRTKEKELFVERADTFTDEELHCRDKYKVVKVEDINTIVRKVYYDYK